MRNNLANFTASMHPRNSRSIDTSAVVSAIVLSIFCNAKLK